MRDRLVDRRVKELLLEVAKRELSPREVAEWLYDEFGVRVRPEWKSIERAILRASEIRGQELALLLLEKGVDIPEREWIEITTRYERSIPRSLRRQDEQ